MRRLDHLREQQHRDLGLLGADLDRRPRALVGLRRRHADVHDRDVGLEAADGLLQLVRVRGLRRRPRSRRRSARARAPRAGAPSPRRSRRARDLPDDARPRAGRALDDEPAATRLDPVREAAQARTRVLRRRRPRRRPRPRSTSRPFSRRACYRRLRGVRVLHDVRERLADDEVRGRLDVGRRSARPRRRPTPAAASARPAPRARARGRPA